MTPHDLATLLAERPDIAVMGECAAVKNKGGRPRKPPTSSEHEQQVKLFAWADSYHTQETYPETAYLFAIPNGGHRHPAVGFKLKREGCKPGVLDIMLPVARCGRHGLWIEMKY